MRRSRKGTARDMTRLKRISIDADFLVTAINWSSAEASSTYLALREAPPLPNGAVVVSVNANWASRCIDALVQHESFEPVPPGEEPPRLDPTHLYRVVKHPLKDDSTNHPVAIFEPV